MKHSFFTALLFFFAFSLGAVVTQDTVQPGKWCKDIDLAVAYADLHGMPLLAVWGSSTCGHCIQLAEALDTSEFINWAASRKLVMCYGEDDNACRKFCRYGSRTLSYFPYVCVYWPKSGGRTIKENFTGMMSYMPVKSEPTRAGCLIASVEKYIKDYQYIDPDGIAAFAAVGRDMASAANPWTYSRHCGISPMFATNLDARVMDGSLALSISAKNKITAKYTGMMADKPVSFSGTWATIDLASGYVSTTIVKSNLQLGLIMSSDGVVEIELSDCDSQSESAVCGSLSLDGSCDSKFDGNYVLLLKSDADSTSKGTGYVSLTLKNGKASYKGVMTDGSSVSGTTSVACDDSGILVPVFKRTSKTVFSIPILVSNITDDLISMQSCCPGFIRRNNAETKLTAMGYGAICNFTPSELQERFELADQLVFDADTAMASDTGYGPFKSFDPVSLGITTSKFAIKDDGRGALASFKFKQSDGTFSGKIRIQTENCKFMTVPYNGIFCYSSDSGSRRMVGEGTAYFADKQAGKTIIFSIPVYIRSRARISSATVQGFAIAREGLLSGLQRGS